MSRMVKYLTAGAVAASAALAPATGQAETIQIANWLPPVHHMTKTMAAWVDSVVKASGGKLTIKVDKTALAKPPGQYDLAVNGIRDITWGVPAYTPGRFVALRLWEMPFLSPSAEVGSEAAWVWYEKHGLIEKEFGDTHLVTVWVHGPGILHTKKRVSTLADLKGVKLRVGGGGIFLAKQLGAVPVAMPATKAHESLRRGITAGVFFPFEAVKGFRLEKLVRHHLLVPGGLYTVPFFLTMNKKKWDALSANGKAALNKAGRRAGAKLIGRHWDAADKVGMEIARKNGNTIEDITPAELKKWRARTDAIFTEYLGKMKKAGYDGAALLADLRATVKSIR
ncbi:MAG: TRAP transporter substrate-binding protein [Rhodospirillaceae bacterium]|nr:TRAP transporter substrate-binding protein [Rhodospirillaceae bacterium]MYB13711.1 TRAP transporter substrate-binding protein [Rhodospirillaceae bacterium]MYI47998.1 TRAP transporter substrate-binding protein [Rhodospirillaceae bacterium]